MPIIAPSSQASGVASVIGVKANAVPEKWRYDRPFAAKAHAGMDTHFLAQSNNPSELASESPGSPWTHNS